MTRKGTQLRFYKIWKSHTDTSFLPRRAHTLTHFHTFRSSILVDHLPLKYFLLNSTGWGRHDFPMPAQILLTLDLKHTHTTPLCWNNFGLTDKWHNQHRGFPQARQPAWPRLTCSPKKWTPVRCTGQTPLDLDSASPPSLPTNVCFLLRSLQDTRLHL